MDILAVAALFGVTLVAAAANKLVRTSRNVERDPAGNPTLKHLYVQYVLAFGSAELLAVAAWQFAEPSVRHDMDSVALFVITPVIFGLLAAAASRRGATPKWAMRQDSLSPAYTQKWSDILKVR